MSVRQSDLLNSSSSQDFVVRKSIPPMWQLLILFVICFSCLLLVLYYASAIGLAAAAFAIFSIIGPLCWFTVYFNQRNRDMVLAAEFQNAIFSAAARLKSRFCIIVKKDGTIFYYDRGFQAIFPDNTQRGTLMVDKVLNSKLITPTEAEKLYRALDNNSSEAIFLTFTPPGGEEQKLVITIDPLPRPQGFFILRGRDYVVKQYEKTSSPAVPASISGNKDVDLTLSHVIHMLPEAIYTTDADGNFLFANFQFENQLGYAQNEIVGRRLNVHDLLPNTNTPLVESILLKPCEGAILFRAKHGETVQLYLKQDICKDERGAVVGSTALLTKIQGNESAAQNTAYQPIQEKPF